jgi:hypothetical protein
MPTLLDCNPHFVITHADQDGAVVELGRPEYFWISKTYTRRDGSTGIRRFNEKGTAFRIFDDDGVLCFRGRYHRDAASAGAFAPLDWAQNEVGATRIDYRQPDGTWQTL